MKPSLLLFVVASILGSELSENKALNNDFRTFQGEWRFLEVQSDLQKGGMLIPQSEIKKWKLKFEGNKFRWIFPDREGDAEPFNLQPDRKPKWIDSTTTVRYTPFKLNGKAPDPSEVKTESRKTYGIYELCGNKLTICFPITSIGSNVRPIEFRANQGSGCMLWVLERVEPKK